MIAGWIKICCGIPQQQYLYVPQRTNYKSDEIVESSASALFMLAFCYLVPTGCVDVVYLAVNGSYNVAGSRIQKYVYASYILLNLMVGHSPSLPLCSLLTKYTHSRFSPSFV